MVADYDRPATSDHMDTPLLRRSAVQRLRLLPTTKEPIGRLEREG